MGRRLSLIVVLACLMTAACTTLNRSMTDELQADLPRAQGLGSFVPSCLFLCFARAEFVQGDVQPVAVQEPPAPVNKRTGIATKRKGPKP